MEFEFKCPHCHKTIKASDFDTDTTIINSINELFNHQKEKYISNLRREIAQTEIFQVETKLNNQFNEQKHDLVLGYNNQISLLKNQIENQQLASQQLMNEEKNKWDQNFNKTISELNELINHQKQELSNYQINLNNALLQKELELNKIKQSEINQYEKKIVELEKVISNNDANIKQLIAEKKEIWLKEIQPEFNSLNKQIVEKQSTIDNLEILKQKEILNIELELNEKHNLVEKQLNTTIAELKEANAQMKVIQAKVKGENFEHEVEVELRKAFDLFDHIEKINVADKKADFLQIIKNNNGNEIGRLVYEVKNAEWSNAWEKKLITDMANQKSKYGILVATSFNKVYPGIPFKRSENNKNIYMTDSESFVFVAQILRSLIELENKLSTSNSSEEQEKWIKFNEFRDYELPKVMKIFQSSFEDIETSENSILKRVDKIRISREKMYRNWTNTILKFIENFNI